MSEPKRHHFLPRFHLANWCDSDGNVLASTRSKDGSVKQIYVKPSETAFQNHLYALPKAEVKHKQIIEREFFSSLDSLASNVFQKIKLYKDIRINKAERVVFTHYLIAAKFRTPDLVAELKSSSTEILTKNLQSDPNKYEFIKGSAIQPDLVDYANEKLPGLLDGVGLFMLPNLITDMEFTNAIKTMFWWVEDFSKSSVKLVISDRPLFISLGLRDPNCLIAMPITPDLMFFASNNPKMRAAQISNGKDALAIRCNESISSGAVRFIYGSAETDFIERMLPR